MVTCDTCEDVESHIFYMQGVLLPGRQTLRGNSRHEDKHY